MTALEQDRYAMGECIACGDRLDDVSLAAGFERCGTCDPISADEDEEDAITAAAWGFGGDAA